MGFSSFIQNYMIDRFNKKHEPLFEAAVDLLITPFQDWPTFRPAWTIGFGSGAVSAVIAEKALALASANMVGSKVVFVGGLLPTKSLKAGEILPKLSESGLMTPKASETEAKFMQRCFLTRTPIDIHKPPSHDIDVYASSHDKSTNTAENLDVAKTIGWEGHFRSVGLVTLPYHTYRTMATLKKVFEGVSSQPNLGANMIVMPHPVWPVELGIGPDNYRDSPIARYMLLQEYLKVGHPSPEEAPYVKKGFCRPVNLSVERSRVASHKIALGS